MKTLKDLELKAWYRLLKVVYLLAFIFVLVIYNFVSYADKPTKSNYAEIDKNKTKIICLLGNTRFIEPSAELIDSI